jgi:hypothetical protein
MSTPLLLDALWNLIQPMLPPIPRAGYLGEHTQIWLM